MQVIEIINKFNEVIDFLKTYADIPMETTQFTFEANKINIEFTGYRPWYKKWFIDKIAYPTTPRLANNDVYEKIVVECSERNMSTALYTKFCDKTIKSEKEVLEILNGLFKINSSNCSVEMSFRFRTETMSAYSQSEFEDSDPNEGYDVTYTTLILKIK